MSNPESSSADFEVNSNPAETSTLFSVIDRDKVFGLNLTVPEDAKELIKPWNERESVDKWVDSGVDDQVRIHIKPPPDKDLAIHKHTVSSSYTYLSLKTSKFEVFYWNQVGFYCTVFSEYFALFESTLTVMCFQHEETYAHIDSGFTPTFLME